MSLKFLKRMSTLSNIPNTPFSPEQQKQLDAVLPTLTPAQLNWLGGYFTALGSGGAVPAQSGPEVSTGGTPLTILYGSQTGNGESIAEAAAEKANSMGFQANLISMGDYKTNQLKKEKNLMVVVSTHGEGDPPDMTEELHEFIYSKRASKLGDLKFTVLALGDTSYEFFCKTGKDFDERFEALGGTRFYPRVDCDLDYDQEAENWIAGSLDTLMEQSGSVTVSSTAVAPFVAKSAYDRKNPFKAEILDQINLNGQGSAKETLHIELSLEDSGMTYEAGDALGVYPNNDPVLAEQVLNQLKFSGTEDVEVGGEHLSLAAALQNRLELTVLTKPVVAKYAAMGEIKELEALLADDKRDEFRSFAEGRDLLDLIKEYPATGFGAQDFVNGLRKLPARLYSIASSLLAYPDEVHLTVAVVRYTAHGRDRAGVCSSYFADRTAEEGGVPVYVDGNKNFKLPTDNDTPVVMIGPGTGIAPFRAFIQEREALGANGPSWLFFGDQHFDTDFLYQAEWQKYLKNGSLNRLDVAFSRDQNDKVYVQHRMMERSKELYGWLQEGAHLYVCGDEKNMAHDVQTALNQILCKEGDMKEDQATEYVRKLQKEKRYQRDVY